MHKLKTCGKNQATKECTEGFQRAIGKPFGRARRRDSPATIKIKYENVQGEGVKGATANFIRFHCPLVASAEAKSPACRKEQLCLKDQQFGRAHLARHSIVGRKCSLGALLREREVTGRDASLPAPLLAASLGLVGRETVGALPQTPQGTLSLDPARGNPPLSPSRD